jgi:membrane-associated PAP2 superfamily phosphatase
MTAAPRNALRRRDLQLTGLGLLLILAWEATGWDMALARIYGSASGFAWRDAWLTSTLLHDGGRWLAALVLAVVVWDLYRPVLAGPTRAERAYWLGAVLLSLLLVPLIKRFSSTSCPWELAEFGGAARYVWHGLLGVRDGGEGHCFPSGHAVAAFAFWGLHFQWREHRPRFARAVLVGVALLGLAFGWGQMARGAHYVSHTLWSAWLCWASCVAAALLSERVCRRCRSSTASPGVAARPASWPVR